MLFYLVTLIKGTFAIMQSNLFTFYINLLPVQHNMLGVGLMVRVVGFGSEGPEFKSRSVVELIPGGVDSACHPSKVGKMSASMLVYCVGVGTHPGLCPIAKETT